MRSRGRALLLVVLLGLAAVALAQSSYVDRLDAADRVLQQAERQRAAGMPDARRAAAAAREALGDEAPPSVIEAATTPSAENVARARREIALLRRVGTLSPPPSTAPAIPARQALDQVLARREFHTLDDPATAAARPAPEWWQRFTHFLGETWSRAGFALSRCWHWILSGLRSLLPKASAVPASGASPGWWAKLATPLLYVLYILLIGGILFLVGLVVSRLVAARGQHAPRAAIDTPDEAPRDGTSRRPELTPWEQALQQAEALRQAGRPREGLRVLQQACLALLDRRGLLRYDESRANGEVLRALRRAATADVHESLRPVLHAFDRSWYGYLEINDAEFGQVVESTHRFHDAVYGGTQ